MTYPRSFLGLLLAGFTLVAAPLVGALAYAAWNTEQLATQSRTAVFNASQAARASRSLLERIGSIERLAQPIAVLHDSHSVASHERARADALHRQAHRPDRRRHPPARRRRLLAADFGARARRFTLFGKTIGLAAQAPRGVRNAEEPLPAPRVARAEDAAHRPARG